ncbi:hypothetical protein G9A89_000066 [Geosiphon pyriformis]|nr:hypothetical protein G9A89_000066 [Geosiphon pyriformis]
MKLWSAANFSDQGTMDEDNPFECFKLTRTQRLYGFGICFVSGFLISILSTLTLISGNIVGFAILYTIGNVVSLLSTGFLVGFTKQIKTMFAPVRWVASAVFLGSMVTTLIVAFLLEIFILCLILCVVQFLALFWYSASYIPYGRTIIKKQATHHKKSLVYTRTGDAGTSSLYNGERRLKTDEIFHALGDVDELNSSVGIANHYCKKVQNGLEDRLIWIQCKLIELSSNIATPRATSGDAKLAYTAFEATNVDTLESWIDELDEQLPPLKHFILPSGGESAIFLHQCRSICRRAERAVVCAAQKGVTDLDVQRFLNRLSDFFFVAARFAAKFDGSTENFYQQRRKDKESSLVTRELNDSS